MTDQQVIEIVRMLLGGITTEEISDTTIIFFWTKWKLTYDLDNHPEKIPVALYNTVVDCVRWLIVQEVSSGNSSIRERFEKIGDETISVKGGSSWESWKDFLDWLELNPDYIDPSLAFNSSLVIIGGVRQNEFFRVKNDPNSYNGFMEQGVSPTPAIPRQSAWPCDRYRRSPWMVR